MKCLQNLLAWQVFVAACRTRSISEAAVLADIDLPKASRLIAGLEKELGKSLFEILPRNDGVHSIKKL